MSVTVAKELPRTMEGEIGQSTKLIRTWICTIDDATLTGTALLETDVFTATGTTWWGAAHPNFAIFKLRKLSYAEGYEGSPYHVKVVGEYGIVKDDEFITPVSRNPVWTFETAGAEVPALFYYSGSGNGNMQPLTNSAYDYFQGLTTMEGMVQASVTKNFSSLPTSQLNATNAVNNASYIGGAAGTWRVVGVDVKYVYEEFQNAMIKYWSCTSKLTYRQTGHNLLLPDVGFNSIVGGQRQRCMVFDFQNSEWVASPTPQGLNGSGTQTGGAPAILTRRVYPETSFSALFGAAPT